MFWFVRRTGPGSLRALQKLLDAAQKPHAPPRCVQEGLLTMAVPEDRPEVAALVPKISISVVLVTKVSACSVALLFLATS